MRPVRTTGSNYRLDGGRGGAGDAWVERRKALLPGVLGLPTPVAVAYLDFEPTDEEREAIAGGALIRLGVWGAWPVPAVSLEARGGLVVVAEQPAPASLDA